MAKNTKATPKAEGETPDLVIDISAEDLSMFLTMYPQMRAPLENITLKRMLREQQSKKPDD